MLNSNYIGPIAVVAYSYMALVPIVQPIVIKGLTTKNERCIHMDYNPKSISTKVRLLFPIIVIGVVGLLSPESLGLVGAGISAFPMASRVVQKLASKEERGNIILMHAAGANVAGQIASAIAGGLVIRIVADML